MIYDGSNRIVKLINAEHLRWKPGSFDVKPRKVCALAFRVKGTADMVCAGNHLFIDAGDVLYMPQGLGYQVDYTETEMIAFHFVTEHDDPQPEVYRLHDRSAVHQLMLHAADLWTNKEPGYVNYCTALLHQVLGQLCAQQLHTQMPPRFQNAINYIHQNFREYYNTSPMEYIRKLRLEYARNLITGGLPVEQAAVACGIGDPKYFARLVRQCYGCTPRQLKLHGK